MTDKKHKKDYDFAQKICLALRKGKTQAIAKVYKRFHRRFLIFAPNKLFRYGDPENVVSNYWVELMDGKYICKYNGSGSLKNYLWLRLNDRIKNEICKMEKEKAKVIRFSECIVNPGDDRSENDQIDSFIHKNISQGETSCQTPDDQLASKQKTQIFNDALFELETKHPRDAYYIKMHLDGMTYKQMAQNELGCENTDEAVVKKKADAIKVQFTRKKKTGSLLRFKKILVQKMLYDSLFELETEHPRDAYYIKMHLDGMTYKQMAQNELGCENTDEAVVKKKADAIKVQFTRKKIGSLARLKKIMVRNMDKY
ncbi:hypothetical protein QUF90_13395 [Desulfococcaceae bacterium HSG9]|nr:hypothetical protein [Desulfococcaceae bacterium HSG9]